MYIYYIILNLATLTYYILDKNAAKNNKWRTKESILLGLTLLGGFVGAGLGIYLFRHKSKKLYFKLVLFLSIIIHTWIITKYII